MAWSSPALDCCSSRIFVSSIEVVTAIEVLSPVNKRPGKGRQTYENKRERVFASATHLVEIDLLRSWEPMPLLVNSSPSHYRILVSRGDCRPSADLYTFNLQDQIPPFPLPLRMGDSEPVIDLQTLLSDIYDRAAYDLKVDYTTPPAPIILTDPTVIGIDTPPNIINGTQNDDILKCSFVVRSRSNRSSRTHWYYSGCFSQSQLD